MKRLLALFLISGSCLGQDYINQYTSHAEMLKQLKQLGVQTQQIGTSRSGKSIIVAQFGDKSSPAILVTGNVDGDYLVGTELAMRLIEDLKSGKVTRNGKSIFIVPMPNPDATSFILGKNGYSTTFNHLKIDDDNDLKINEDGPNDLNNDGFISQLRISDSSGPYKASEQDPSLLVKVDRLKNEAGQYRLLNEGKDDDGDGKLDEDGYGGTAINKNFTYNYDYFGIGSGVNQASEPETRALIDFVIDHQNILMTVNFSKYDNLHENWSANKVLVSEYKRPLEAFDKMPKEDVDGYKLFTHLWQQAHKDWQVKAENRGQGTFHDWAYFHGGRWSIATNGWNFKQITIAQSADEEKNKDADVEKNKNASASEDTKEARLVTNAKEKNLQGAIIPWTNISHPDFVNEKVEVGGFRLAYLNNPDISVFTETKSSEYITSLTTLFPEINVSQSVKKIGKDLYRVTLKIKNIGKLPTQSAMGKLTRWMLPVRVQWNLPKEQFIGGSKRTLLAPIAAHGGQQEIKWLINTKGFNDASFEVSSPVIDAVTQTVNFGA
ncbi:hypothetical protein H4J57_10205 [Colwellia sp. BRX8-7]|jgi:hypothetical protein|uniref:M14 family zinc carboxypeptidase n=1 Tax=Colwellia sp. BRX8-7 TaxID=2759833 RepID=UPI0015F49F0F|nr:M14 family zinc carboxypeptidase [Colwellia sp. BRX8-7]MBA6337573.1 hypothetical protein [Colwellia sp. BRX8-7]